MTELLTPIDSVALIFNPASGKRNPDTNLEIVQTISEQIKIHGGEVELFATADTGHATEHAIKAIDKGHTIIFVAGGDGTLRQTVSGAVDTDVPVGFLPLGSENIWADETNTSNDPLKAFEQLMYGEEKVVDTGSINGDTFLLNGGMGMDAETFHMNQRPGKKKSIRGGMAAHVWPTLVTVPFFRGVQGELTIGDETFTHKFTQAWAGNARQLGPVVLRPEAQVDDRLLEFTAFTGSRGIQMVPHFLSGALWPTRGERPGSIYRQGTTMKLHLEDSIAVQADGDSLPRAKDIIARVLPASLRVRVPRAQNDLFSRR